MNGTEKRRADRVVAPMVLIISALVACVTSHPGKVPGDTKLSLYLNPLRLVSDSVWTWDQRMFSGWVPHQNVGYLWPSGPFFSLLDAIGSPDWLAHRLWIASLMAIAGVGAFRFARHLGLSMSAAFLAGAAYEFSPYVLPYISRTSALLLPWSLLPWLLVVVLRYADTRRWRDVAIFGLLIASSGGLNATALLMIAPAPLIWLIDRRRTGSMSLRSLFSVTSKLAVVAAAVSTWWLAGLFVQGRYGAAVLSYSEALTSTSATSSTPEVLRGLGYWLFYDRGPAASLTSASAPYQSSIPLIVLSASLVVLSLWGITRAPRWRRPLSAMLLVGAVLAVGAHPFSEPNALFRPLASNPKDALSLALRSSTRAVPMIVLALAVGLGHLWASVSTSNRRFLRLPNFDIRFAFAIAMIVGNFPAALNGDIVDRALLRPERVPDAWTQAADYLDDRFEAGHTGSVLLVPGIESAAYRWGYPVDPILPALSRKPLLTRDWLPLGAPAVMDLLYALDDSFQDGTVDPDSIAPVARMLGADTIMVVNSHQYERFGTIRPSRAIEVFDPLPAGLTFLADFGPAMSNLPTRKSSDPPRWSEEYVSYPDVKLPEIALYAVDDATAPAREFSRAILAATDGTGLVDLAANDFLDGSELVISEASLDAHLLSEVTTATGEILVTDSNRRRAHHWRGSQDVWGATESGAGVLSVRDDFDSRLPIHPSQDESSQTVVEDSPLGAVATAYGPELRYHPEYRPRMAVDGDPLTAWRISPGRTQVGHILSLESDVPLTTLNLLQPLDSVGSRWITNVSIRIDDGDWQHVDIDQASLSTSGTRVALSRPGRRVDIRIDAVAEGNSPSLSNGVGFAEVVPADIASAEVIRLPRRVDVDPQQEISYSLTRLRSDPFDRRREDPERSMIRRLPYPAAIGANFSATVRLSVAASDETLMQALGVSGGFSRSRLDGTAAWWGPAAFDGSPATAWHGPVIFPGENGDLGSLEVPMSEPMEWFEFEQGTGTFSSRINRVNLSFLSSGLKIASIDVDVDPSRRNRTQTPRIDADSVVFTVIDVEESVVRDADTGSLLYAPVGISELRSNAWDNVPPPVSFDSGCRGDLIAIDGASVSIRLTGRVDAALSGAPVSVVPCGNPLESIASDALLTTAPGSESGWDIDRLALGVRAADTGIDSIPVQLHSSRSRSVADLSACAGRCWIEFPFGHSPGWTATLDGADLEPVMRSAPGRSLWRVEDVAEGTQLTAIWTPQRFMWWGISLSVSSLVALLVLAAFEWARMRRRSDESMKAVESSSDSVSAVAVGVHRRSRIRSALLGAVLGVLLVSPFWGIAIGCAFLLFPSRFLARFAPAAVALGYAFVVVQLIRNDPQPGFLWPSAFERSHRPMMSVLIVFTVALHNRFGFDSNPSGITSVRRRLNLLKFQRAE